jgi:hypothetical protein
VRTVAARLALAVAAAVAAPGVARADAFARLPEGAPLYAATRPVALLGALQKLGVSELPAMQKLRQGLGGIDPFNPAILAAPGIDVAAPLAAALLAPAGPNLMHTRVAAALRDRAAFDAFVLGVIASGQVKLAAATGIKDAVAAGNPSSDVTLLVRVVGDEAVIDVYMTRDGKKAPTAAELARRMPLVPARPMALGHGARRLFAPDAAAVVYVDGRKLTPLLVEIAADDAKRELSWAGPDERAALLAKQRARQKKCALWQKSPSVFDDAGVALTAAPDSLTLTWAWGTAAGPALGGLKLAAVDDAALDAAALARDAAGVLALYAANLAPFSALKRSGVFASTQALSDAVDGCDTMAGALLALRSWPLAIGTLLSSPPPPGSPLVAFKQSLGTLRNLVLAVRDSSPGGPRFAVAASFDDAARPTLETLIAAFGAQGTVTPIGKRSPTVYAMQLPGMGHAAAAALEVLAGNRLGFTVADSDESLAWAYKAGSGAPVDAAASPPLARLDLDATQAARLGALVNASRDEQAVLDLLAKLRHVDGTLAADGDLLRLSLHAPLRP